MTNIENAKAEYLKALRKSAEKPTMPNHRAMEKAKNALKMEQMLANLAN